MNESTTATARVGFAARGFFCAGLSFVLSACGSGEAGTGSSPAVASPSGDGTSGGSSAGPLGGTRGIILEIAGGPNDDSGGGGGRPGDQVITSLPPGFRQTEIGGYKLGDRLAGGGGGAGAGAGGSGGAMSGDCGNVLLGVVRDFKGVAENGGHADFEPKGIQGADATPGMVSATLGADKKPVYASMCEVGRAAPAPTCPFGAQNTSQASFDSWYRDTPGVNDPFMVSLYFAPRPGGLFTFQSLTYFPVDGAGFMSAAQANDGMPHNFGFTTELHTQFVYKGGETFTFEGDDDVWVYINGKLAVDLGGLHPMRARPIQLDTAAAQLGITKGAVYPLDLFHAERHTTASTFRIDTNLSFVDCGTVVPSQVK